jgi:hypothetical protein
LDHHAGRFDQHAEATERRRDLQRKVRLDAKPFRSETVALLDASLRVLAVAAHVPLADGAVRTGDRIRPPHDRDDEIAARKPDSRGASRTRPNRLVAKN